MNNTFPLTDIQFVDRETINYIRIPITNVQLTCILHININIYMPSQYMPLYVYMKQTLAFFPSVRYGFEKLKVYIAINFWNPYST